MLIKFNRPYQPIKCFTGAKFARKMAVFRVNFEDELYLDYLQQLECYPQTIFIDKGDPFNTLHEIQFHARFWLRRVHGDRVIDLIPFLAAHEISSRVAERFKAVAHG